MTCVLHIGALSLRVRINRLPIEGETISFYGNKLTVNGVSFIKGTWHITVQD